MAEITTVEELDALPVGSVVRAADGCVFEYWTYPVRSHWYTTGGVEHYSAEELRLPATLLFRPDRPTRSVNVSNEQVRHIREVAEETGETTAAVAHRLLFPDQPTPSTTVTAEQVEAAARAIRVTREFQAGASFGIPADAHQQAAEGMARAALGITVEGGEQRGE